jgi:cation diffusion facilitator family transporter
MHETGRVPDEAAFAGAQHGTRSQRVLYVAIAGDIAIAISKFVAAAFTGSSAMLAEGVHSLVDTGNELLLLHGVKSSRRAVDEWHPFGYGKATYVWALMVALSVFSVGGGVSIYEGIVSLGSSPVLGAPTWNYIVLAVAAGFEGLSWRVSRRELNRHRRPGESLWQVSQRSMDVLVFTVFVEDSAALIGIVIAALGIGLGHAFHNPYFDPAASLAIGVVLIGAAGLLARKSGRLLIGQSIGPDQLAQVRKIISADAAVERVGHLLTMRLGPDNVLLTAAVRFQRRLNLDDVEQAIERLEHAIKVSYPAIQHLYLESGALKAMSRSVRHVAAQTAPQPFPPPSQETFMSQYQIAVVVGSLRKASFNRQLADAVVKLAPPGFSFKQVRIDDLPLYNQDDDANQAEPVKRLKAEIVAAQGVLFVTAEYNRSIPGVLKNAIDHASRPYGQSAWAGKPAGVLGVSGGAVGTAMAQQHLRNVLAYLDMPTLGQPEAFIHAQDGLFDAQDGIGAASRKFLQGWMDSYVAWVGKHAG